MSEPHSDKTDVQNANFETNPLADLPWGLVFISGSEECMFPFLDSPSSQTNLEISL